MLLNFYAYIVLDNVKTLFKMERSKRPLQKLCCMQKQTMKQSFSMLVVHDALVKDIDIFKEA